MALLDVSEVLLDPDFADAFPVIRRSEVIGNNGRVSVDALTLPAVGVITAASPNDLERLPEDQRTERTICIVTKFRLRATAPDYLPDLVGWRGSFYVVADLQPYTQYGSGFVQALCSSITYQDEPPPDPDVPQGFPPIVTQPSLITIYGNGVPIDGPVGTGAGNSAPGRIYIDQATGTAYINQSQDRASPVWKLIPREA